MANEKKPVRRKEDLPGFWFVKLEEADAQGDWDTAAEAQRNLKRLGWNVTREKQGVA